MPAPYAGPCCALSGTRAPWRRRSALSPGSVPTDPTDPDLEAGLREALGPGPFEEDVRVAILVAAAR